MQHSSKGPTCTGKESWEKKRGEHFVRNLKLDLLFASIRHGNQRLDLLNGYVIGEVQWVAAGALTPACVIFIINVEVSKITHTKSHSRHQGGCDQSGKQTLLRWSVCFKFNYLHKAIVQHFTSVTPFSTSQKTSTGCPDPSGSKVYIPVSLYGLYLRSSQVFIDLVLRRKSWVTDRQADHCKPTWGTCSPPQAPSSSSPARPVCRPRSHRGLESLLSRGWHWPGASWLAVLWSVCLICFPHVAGFL